MKNYLHMLRFIYGYTIHLDNIYGEMKCGEIIRYSI